LVDFLGVHLHRLPVLDGVAECAADAASVLAEGSEDIEVRLCGTLTEKLHLLRYCEPRIGGQFNLVVERV
jgi:hypothetical protein